MRIESLPFYGLALAAAWALAGCSGTPTGGAPIGAAPAGLLPSPALRQFAPLGRQARAAHSWMAAGLNHQDLIYVTNGNGLVSVFRYWQHTIAGVLTDFTNPAGECADKSGDVYITDYGADTISEYSHGGSQPINVIDDSPYAPISCAVDPTTDNLAVANYNTGGSDSYNTGNVAIYAHGKGKPAYYGSGDDFTGLTYDDHGDLLITALYYYYYYEYYSYYSTTVFYYLPKKGSKLLSIELPNKTSGSSEWSRVESMGYDGKYWVVVSSDSLYRYTISVKAEEVDVLKLSGISGYVNQLSFYRKTQKGPATQVVGGGDGSSGSFVGYWKYPALGDPYEELTTYLDGPFGVAISLHK